jgi:tetratricopeptide (TPR) repeat protein
MCDCSMWWQQRHLDLAVEANNLVEQQRAHTQLGRTYMDMYDIKDWLWALPKAKESFNKAMDLAQTLKSNPPPGSSNFVIELVDAYNNLGTLRMITDEPVEARRLLQMGLRLCNAEEVGENDATRTRLHHNLGRLYSEKRQWSAAMLHSLKDIEICRAIPHPQGEVKGLINLADIHFKQRQYTDAIKCYSIALQIVRNLQDEDDLKKIVESNKNVVEAAVPKLGELNGNLAELKELQTKVDAAQGSASERSLCLQEYKMLVKLIREAFELQYWEEVRILVL